MNDGLMTGLLFRSCDHTFRMQDTLGTMACSRSQISLKPAPTPPSSKNKTSTTTAFGYPPPLPRKLHTVKVKGFLKSCFPKKHYRFSSNIKRLTMRLSENCNHNLKANNKKFNCFFFLFSDVRTNTLYRLAQPRKVVSCSTGIKIQDKYIM